MDPIVRIGDRVSATVRPLRSKKTGDGCKDLAAACGFLLRSGTLWQERMVSAELSMKEIDEA